MQLQAAVLRHTGNLTLRWMLRRFVVMMVGGEGLPYNGHILFYKHQGMKHTLHTESGRKKAELTTQRRQFPGQKLPAV